MSKKLNILIRAELDKNKFMSEVDEQIRGLQKILESKNLKVDVNLGDVQQLQNTSNQIGDSLKQGMKASQDEMKKMQKTLEKLQKEMKEIDNNRADAIRRAKKDWEAMQKDTVWGKTKEFGVRRPKKGEQFYDEFRQLPESVRKNRNYWKPASQTKYNSIDQFLQESGLKISPSQMMEMMKKGVPTFNQSKNVDPATLSGIKQGEQRINDIRKQISQLEHAIKNQISLTDRVEQNINNQTKAVEKQANAVDKVASKWKTVSVATTSIGEGKEQKDISRIINQKDQYGNRMVTRQVKDENENWVKDSQTYIASLQEIDDAKKKFQIKGEKWSDRLAKLHADAFKMNNKQTIKDIQELQKSYEKLDSTSDKLEFQKLEHDMQRVEKRAKEQVSVYDKIIKKQKELQELNQKTYKDGVFNDNDIRNNYNKINSVNKNGGEKELERLEQIEKRMKERIAVLKEEQKIRGAVAQAEEKSLKKREEYLTRIKALERQGLGKDTADKYRNLAENNQFDSLDKRFKALDRYMNRQKELSTLYDKQFKDKERQDSINAKTLEYEQKTRDAIAKAKEINDQKELKRLRTLSREQDKYINKIRDMQGKGLINERSANSLMSMIRGATTKDGIQDSLDKRLKAIERMEKNEKNIAQVEAQRLNIQRQLSSLEDKHRKEQEKAKKNARELAETGKITVQRYKEMYKEIQKSTIEGKELEKITSKISVLSRRVEGSRVERNIIGKDKSLKDLTNVSDKQISDMLRANEAFKNRQILTASVDRATGKWTATIRENGKQERVLRGEIDRTNGALVRQSETIRDTSARNMSFLEQFKIAIMRVPIWAIAMTAIYGTKRALEQMTGAIIEVDKQMTELKRVMSADTDFNGMLREAVSMSRELGNNLTDVNNALIGFARQGFKGQDALDMTNTAIVASNVSELKADEAMENLTAIMVQFNIEASESIRIIDALNEVDNNFAITTKNLADATAKAGATAQTFGVDFEAMLGHVTAIGVATRESGSVIGNSLKTIYSRLTTMDEAISSLESVGIATKDASGEMRSVKEILDELYTKWGDLSKAQQQNLGVTLAGRYQLSRFLALMNNYEMGLDATETALSSQGSAMEENSKYMKSLEAQINQMKVAWSEMALAMGDSIIIDTLIVSIGVIKDFMGTLQSLAESGWLLPAVFGAVGVAVYATTGSVRTFTASMIPSIAGMKSFGASVWLYITNPLVRATATTVMFNTAISKLKTIGATIGKGLAFTGAIMAVGFALEFFISKVAESNRIAKEAEEKQKEQIKNYKEQKESIAELVTEYERLSLVMDGKSVIKPDLKTEERYVQLQNELARLLPSIAKGTDGKGNSILDTTEAIKEHIATLERMIELEKEQAKAKSPLDIENAFEKIDEIKNDKNELPKLNRMIENYQKQLDDAIKNKDFKTAVEIEIEMKKVQIKKGKMDEEINNLLRGVDNSIQNFFNDIDITDKARIEISSLLSQLDFKGKDAGDIKNTLENIVDITQKYNEELKNGSKNEAELTKLKQRLEQVFSSQKNGTLEVQKFTRALEMQYEKTEEINNETRRQIMALGDYAQAMDTSTMSIEENISTSERLSLTTKKQIDAGFELLGMYNLMSQAELENAEKSEELLEVINQLTRAYPAFVKGTEVNVEAIKNELRAKEVLLQATEDLMSGKLKSEHAMTVATAQESRKRIEIMNKELRQLQFIIQKFSEMSQAGKYLTDVAEAEAEKSALRARENIKRITGDIEIEMPDYNNVIDELAKIIDYKDRDSEADKKNKDAKKESIYTTDEYSKALEQLGLRFKQLEASQGKLTTWSKEYRQGLQKEIALLKEKDALMRKQIATNEGYLKILKSGTIPTELAKNTDITGYNGGVSDATSSSTSNVKMSGWGGKITSNYGMRTLNGKREHHTGIDIAGKRGTPLSANVSGKVVFAGVGKTGSGFSGYGNVVAINSGGTVHLYGHLDSIYVKTGETVKAGDIIGTIGNTSSGGGTSTGSHLHYEVRTSNKYGTDINPTNLANLARQNKTPDGITVSSSSSVSSKSDGLSANEYNNERLKLIDDLTMENLRYEQELLSNASVIEQRNMDIVNSKLESYQRYRELVDEDISALSIRNSYEQTYSKQFRDNLRSQLILLDSKKKKQEEELQYIRNQILYNKDLTEAQREQMRGLLKSGQVALLEIQKTIQETLNNVSTSMLEQVMTDIANNNEKMEDKLRDVERRLSMTEKDNTKQLIDLNKEKLKLLVESRQEAMRNVVSLKAIRNSLVGNKEALQQNADAIKEWSNKIKDVEVDINSLKNSIKDMYINIANEVIDAMKSYYEKRRDMELDAIDSEMKAMEKAHREKMKMYDDELKAFQEIVNAKLRDIDRQESSDDYEKELAERQKKRQEIQDQIDLYSLDNSASARRKVSELKKQLAEADLDIEQFIHKRGIELQKQRLQDELEEYTKQKEEQKEIAENHYDKEKQQLDDRRDAINKHYNNIINDERRWAKVREDILNGNVDSMKKTLLGFADDVGLAMDSVGDSIIQNLVDKIIQAKKQLDSVRGSLQNEFNLIDSQIGKDNNNYKNDSSNAEKAPNKNTKPPSQDDMPYWDGEQMKVGQIGRITVVKPINLWQRDSSGKLVFSRILNPNEKYRVYGYDEKHGGQYDVGGGYWVTNMPGYIKYETPSKDKLNQSSYQKFDTGGYTGDDEGLAMLHKKEIVLNKVDTENFLEAIKMVRSMQSFLVDNNPIRQFVNAMKSTITSRDEKTGDEYHFHIGKVEGTKKGAEDFAERVVKKLKKRG